MKIPLNFNMFINSVWKLTNKATLVCIYSPTSKPNKREFDELSSTLKLLNHADFFKRENVHVQRKI